MGMLAIIMIFSVLSANMMAGLSETYTFSSGIVTISPCHLRFSQQLRTRLHIEMYCKPLRICRAKIGHP